MDDVESAFDVDFEGEIPETVDRAALERMRTVAWVLDECIRVPGTEFRFGLDPILSIVPVVGDAVAAGFSAYIVLESANLGVGYTTLVRMIANIAIDAVGGSVPYAGTVFDLFWRANERNMRLVLQDLAERDSSASEPVEIEVEPP